MKLAIEEGKYYNQNCLSVFNPESELLNMYQNTMLLHKAKRKKERETEKKKEEEEEKVREKMQNIREIRDTIKEVQRKGIQTKKLENFC